MWSIGAGAGTGQCGETARDEAHALEAAQRFATEFSIAQAGGANLDKIGGVRMAIEELSKGLAGRGPYADLIFRVPDVPPEVAMRAAQYLSFDHSILRYDPPVPYHTAWTSGSVAKDRSKRSPTLNGLLAERTAQAFVRVHGAARASGADLSKVGDVETAMRTLEEGISGSGAHSGTTFSVTAAGTNVRHIAKQLLRLEDGALHFIPGGQSENASEVRAIVERERPARLAQQLAAAYAAASSAGADFSSCSRPGDIVTLLRNGIRASGDLGVQLFHISAEGPESDWEKAVSYLQLNGGILTYNPPSER